MPAITAYVTVQELIDAFGERELVELTDRATPRTFAVDEAIAQRACDQAEAEINSAIGARYPLPLQAMPQILPYLARDLARFYLHAHAVPSTVAEAAYKQAIATLKAIRDGLQPLGVTEAGASAGAVQSLPQFEGGAKDFARGSW